MQLIMNSHLRAFLLTPSIISPCGKILTGYFTIHVATSAFNHCSLRARRAWPTVTIHLTQMWITWNQISIAS